MKLQFPRSTHNWITLIGATIALIAFSMTVFLLTISLFLEHGHAYLGLVTYILLPAVMVVGLLLIPIGMFIQMRRDRRTPGELRPPWPRVDLNDPRHRNAFFIFSIGTVILLFGSAVGSYEAFHFTESVTFCGTICHTVMKPEFTAYQHSPHARVACVECHVGSGASWYVRSKLSGAYQVYATLADIHPRPIPTPVTNLRPARETCEQCHWPQKFYARKFRLETHYLADDENTQWNIGLIMKIGAERSSDGLKEGIHWHINPDTRVEYIASDSTRTKLPWVRYTNLKTGEQVVYQDEEEPLSSAQIEKGVVRTMDCIDCHNRPSHDYKTPAKFVETAISRGEIPIELPGLKELLTEMCDQKFPSTDSAMQAIDSTIRGYYRDEYPQLYRDKPELVARAVAGMQQAYAENIFPEMGVRWDAYPNHIGHLDYDGCFRCHNDTHVGPAGERISKNCNLCHLIVSQGTPGEMEFAVTGDSLAFRHPDGDDDWKDGLCTDCHTGMDP